MLKIDNPRGDNRGHRLVFSLGKRNLGFAKTTQKSWGWLLDRLQKPFEDPTYTQAQFAKLPRDVQNERKALPGFILGGPCTDGRRKNSSIPYRTILCLDIDDLTGDQYERWIGNREGGLWHYEFFMHETRSSTDTARRIRIMLPLRDRADFAQFHAVSRIMAEKFLDDPEESMDAVDVVSFRQAQLMFLPSKSKGQPLDQIHNPGDLLEAETILDEWSRETGLDWSEFSALPRSDKRENKAPTEPGKKMEDPFEKPGIIGAFCRAYPIEDAISKFLPEIYRPGDSSGSDIRYTYVPGSGSNGAVVYDGGRFLYSNHGTDPVSDTAVNSWDMVRIHLFGGEDEGVHPNTSPARLPSYRSMVDLAESDDKVREDLASSLVPMFDDLDDLDLDHPGAEEQPGNTPDKPGVVNDLDDLPGQTADTGEDTGRGREWVKTLTVNKNGELEKTRHNLLVILSNDPRIAPCIRYNTMTRSKWIAQPFGFKKLDLPQQRVDPEGRRWHDTDSTALASALSAPVALGGYATDFPMGDVQGAVEAVSNRRRFNPVLDLIESVKWDGVNRVGTFWTDYLGAEDSAYHREAATAWFTAAVTRLYEPGHKFDFVPILIGAQGVGKSSLVEALSLGYFAEMAKDFHNQQKMVESISGAWIVESPELSGFRLAETEDIKRWFSALSDQVRLAYRRDEEEFKRVCVFIGTSNKEEFLRDTTGNRRFWPIHVGVQTIDMARLRKNLLQIWAEARQMYLDLREEQPRGTLPLTLRSREAIEEAVGTQEDAREVTPGEILAQSIRQWLDTPVPASVAFGTGDGFDADDNEPVYLRNLVSVGSLIENASYIPGVRDNIRNTRLLGAALRLVEGFSPVGNHRARGAGRKRWHVRDGGDPCVEWVKVKDPGVDSDIVDMLG